MKLTTVLFTLLVAVAVALALSSNAASLIGSNFKAQMEKVGEKDNERTLLGVFDTGDGNVMFVIYACGYHLEIMAPIKEVNTKAFEDFAIEQIDKACSQ